MVGRRCVGKMCEFFNQCTRERKFPRAWSEAEVVGIFKKGSPYEPASYRPISLLNTTYKLYAALLASRITRWVEPALRGTQYGFRQHRSTGDPIHL
eukprot:7185231-Alexandrium_andersonii.AAC.1